MFVREKSLYKVKVKKFSDRVNRLFFNIWNACMSVLGMVKLKNEPTIRYEYFLESEI